MFKTFSNLSASIGFDRRFHIFSLLRIVRGYLPLFLLEIPPGREMRSCKYPQPDFCHDGDHSQTVKSIMFLA
jgi:hypothetical protein